MAKKKISAAIADWVKLFIHVPEGADVGKELMLRPWQIKELEKIYDNPAGTRRAIISFGRKNAKTTLAAIILLVHLAGPLAARNRNAQLFSAAQSRDQAALLFALAAKMVRMSPQLSAGIKIRESSKTLFCEHYGTTYRALSADASTAYGLSPALVIFDELGQFWKPTPSKTIVEQGFFAYPPSYPADFVFPAKS
jgi:phage terminase large subunit-like protein